jgi:hypothetical protein
VVEEVAKTGKELERRVVEAYRALGAWKVEHDVELEGHQIDVYVELETQDRGLHRIAVEAKEYSGKVGIRIVEDFLVVVDHLRRERLIDEGVIVSTAGFSRPARNAARNARIRLLELDDLQRDIVARRLLEERLVSIAEEEAPLRSLIHSRLVVAYVREATSAGLDPEQLPEDNLGAILEHSVRQIVQRDCRDLLTEYGQVPSTEEFCRLLSYLGWYMFSEGITDCRVQDAAVVVGEAMDELHVDRYSSEQVLDWLAATYWLRRTTGDIFEFRDSYIASVFAAMELKQWFARGFGSVFLLGRTGDPGHKLADEPGRWQQVIVPLAGMLPQDQVVELLECLLEEGLPRLAGWCVAEGQLVPQPIVARVIHALLDRLAGAEQ